MTTTPEEDGVGLLAARVAQEFNSIRGALGTPQIRKPEVVASLTGTGQPQGWTTPTNVRSTDTCVVIVSRTVSTFTPAAGWNTLAAGLTNTGYYGHNTNILSRVVGDTPSTNAGTLPTTGSTVETASWSVLYIRNAGNLYGTVAGTPVRNASAHTLPEYDPPGAALVVLLGTALQDRSIPNFGAPYQEGQAKRYFATAGATFMHRWGLTDELVSPRSVGLPTGMPSGNNDFDRNLWSIRMSGVPADGFVLDELVDVDTAATAPDTGDVLVYDSTTGKWRPGKGGPEVGAWENDLQTAFVYPAPVEFDLQANPPSLPTAKQLAPLFEVTVTPDMLVSNTGADLGYRTVMQIIAVGRCLAGSGNLEVESAHVSAATGTEWTSTAFKSGPSTSVQRTTMSTLSPPIAVGDKVRMRASSSNGANLRIDWWCYRVFVSRLGSKTDGGRVPLFRDLVRTGDFSAGFTPATVLTLGSSSAYNTWQNAGLTMSREQWLERGVLGSWGQNTIPTGRTFISDATTGAMVIDSANLPGGAINGTVHAEVWNSSSSAYIPGMNQAQQWRMDRLYVPAPPN